MAEKKHKKPRHTRLVLPGEKERETKRGHPAADVAASRIERKHAGEAGGQQTSISGPKETKPRRFRKKEADAPVVSPPPEELLETPPPSADEAPAPAAPEEGESEASPSSGVQQQPPLGNAIVLPRQKPRLSPAKRKRRTKRIRRLAVLAGILACLLVYASGAYLFVFISVSNFFQGLSVSLQPGGGLPVEFVLPGYRTAMAMGNNGVALLGDRDVAVLSASGRELQRVQHGYPSPGIVAGSTRLCVYSRGGTEYLLAGLSGSPQRKTTGSEIRFAEMSPSGWLALVTASRYRSTLQVYSPVFGETPQLTWDIVDDKPVSAVFHSDNQTLALACLTPSGGALSTTIYFLRADRDSVQGTIRAADVLPLQMRFVAGNRLLVVFDRFAALYNTDGEELARYHYEGKTLAAADLDAGLAVLLFSSDAQLPADLVLLDDTLAVLANRKTDGTAYSAVLSAGGKALLLSEQQVVCYSAAGSLQQQMELDEKPLGLVGGTPPLLVSTGSIRSLAPLLQAPASVASS